MLLLFLSFSLEENLTNSVELIPPSALAEDSNWLKISAPLWLKKKKKVGLEMDTNSVPTER